MNRGQLVDRVARKMGLETTLGSDDLDFLQDLANAAVVETLLRTHFFIVIGDMALIPGTAEYRLDSSVLAVDDGRGSTPAGVGNFEVVSLEEMIRRQSIGYVDPTWRKVLSFDGNLMIVSPTPDVSESLRFYYVPRPLPMTDDDNDPSDTQYGGLPSEHHRSLEYYMLWQAAEDVEKRVPLGPNDYFTFYMNECKLVRERKWGLAGRKLAPSVVGYPDSRRHPTRNDVYPAVER
jgi:hypothetical protein